MALSEREQKDLRDSLADVGNSPSQLTEKLTAAAAAADVIAAAAAVTAVAQVNASNAGETYNEIATQSIVDLANANKAKINELLVALAS